MGNMQDTTVGDKQYEDIRCKLRYTGTFIEHHHIVTVSLRDNFVLIDIIYDTFLCIK